MEKNDKLKQFFIEERKNIESIFAPNICQENEVSSHEERVINGKKFALYRYKNKFETIDNKNLPNELESISIVKTSIKKDKNKHLVTIEKITLVDNENANIKITPIINEIESNILPCQKTNIEKIFDSLTNIQINDEEGEDENE